MEQDLRFCPWCGEGYPEGRDDAAVGWRALALLEELARREDELGDRARALLPLAPQAQ